MPVRFAASLDGFMRHVETGAMVLSALSIVAITLIVCVEIFLREVFSISTLISAEFAGYLLATNVFLGLAWTFRDGGFIRVEILHGLLQGRVAALLNTVLALFALAVFSIYTWHLIGFVARSYHAGTMSVFITRTPLWIPQMAMPVGSVLMCWAFLSAGVKSAALVLDPSGAEAQPTPDLTGGGIL